ncbi:MAG: SUMF1/EgtB/PvdO family nonheme iron enzyme, partial [Phycisphaerales bacterium]
DVYINDQQAAEEGVEAPSESLTTLLFDAGIGGAITLVGDRYVVVDSKEEFPVVGVTWYGALKFCNWMTLLQGMHDPDQRMYHEGTSPDEWHPVVQAPALIALHGFRLPMDDQAGTASPYNEWYKAAAWIDTLEANSVYGYGRDTLADAAANFYDSGDPFEPGPSEVGFFNGVNELANGSRTDATANEYGLYDMTGNVAEWVQDFGETVDERGIRGGHYQSVKTSPLLRADGRGSVPADAALPFVGFRVVQVIEPAELAITIDRVRTEGPVGGPYTPETLSFQIQNPAQQTVDKITVTINPPWLEIDSGMPIQIPPGKTVSLPLQVADAATTAGISPAPSGDFALVPDGDNQPGGPDHDYWIGRTEISNAQFAAFLNDARNNALLPTPDTRSQHMYFDLDSGSVYINDVQSGGEGFDAPSDTLSALLYDASVGRVSFVDGMYTSDEGFENHPVVGVTWYGAVKYCNWLTIKEGIPAPLRAYDEAPTPNLDGWHPVVVDDATWVSGTMSHSARRFLVEDTLGYRLPMDDESTDASTYNEWYKAASRKGTDQQGNPVFGALYGFGRDSPLAGVDANYLDSGDTSTDGSTSGGFFNGVHTLFQADADCFPPVEAIATRNTDNGYGLYDACGNVAEWTQDFYAGNVSHQATRGGSWRDPADSDILTTTGRGSLSPEVAADDTGFRVVRGTGHVVTATV